jgi:hypothetical protein
MATTHPHSNATPSPSTQHYTPSTHHPLTNPWDAPNLYLDTLELIATLITHDPTTAYEWDEIHNNNGSSALKTPEVWLMVAVLEDALATLLGNGNSERFKQAKSEAWKWFFVWVGKKYDDYLFSFDSVCSHLGLDREFVRRGVLAILEKAQVRVEVEERAKVGVEAKVVTRVARRMYHKKLRMGRVEI